MENLRRFACLVCLSGCGKKQADLSKAEDSPEWAAKLGNERNAEQIFIVAGMGQTTATVSMHQKDASGNWKQIMTTPGYIGKFGLGKTKEGDGMTPVGEECTPGLGSAIFLHCLGPVKPYTGGCVAIPRNCMETVMQNVREDCVVVIDSLETLSPETWDEYGLTGAPGFGVQN